MSLPIHKGKAFSPRATLSESITDIQTSFAISTLTCLPDTLPCELTLGPSTDDPETIEVLSTGSGTITNCTRGYQGTAKTWDSGTEIRCTFTEAAYEDLRRTSIDAIAVENQLISGSIAQYNLAVHKGSYWAQADLLDDDCLANALAIALESGSDGDYINVQNSGIVVNNAWSWTPGAKLYVGESGTLSENDAGERFIGFAIESTKVLLTPNEGVLESSPASTSSIEFVLEDQSFAENIPQYSVVVFVAGQWWLASLESSFQGNGMLTGIALDAGDAESTGKRVQLTGTITNPAWNFTPGAAVTLNWNATAGQQYVTYNGNRIYLGYALSATSLLITQVLVNKYVYNVGSEVTDRSVVIFDGTDGDCIAGTNITIDELGNLALPSGSGITIGGQPLSSEGGSAIILTNQPASENITAGQLVYLSGDSGGSIEWWIASDNVTVWLEHELCGIALDNIAEGNTGRIHIYGPITDNSWNFGYTGLPVWAGLNSTISSTFDAWFEYANYYIQLGWTLSSNQIFFCPQKPEYSTTDRNAVEIRNCLLDPNNPLAWFDRANHWYRYDPSDEYWYLTNATTIEGVSGLIGYAIGYVDGTPATYVMRVQGTIEGASNTDVGPMYLSTNPGTLTATAPENCRIAGYALGDGKGFIAQQEPIVISPETISFGDLDDVNIVDPVTGQLAGYISGSGWTNVLPKIDALANPDDTTNLNATTGSHGLMPKLNGNTDTCLQGDGTWGAKTAGSGSGDIIGPVSATDNAIVRFDEVSGKIVQDSLISIDDSGNLALPSGSEITIGGEAFTAGGGASRLDPVTLSIAHAVSDGELGKFASVDLDATHGQIIKLSIYADWIAGQQTGLGTFQINDVDGAEASQTTIAIDSSTTGFTLNAGDVVRIGNELIKCGASTTTTSIANAVRGYAGTTASFHNDNEIGTKANDGIRIELYPNSTCLPRECLLTLREVMTGIWTTDAAISANDKFITLASDPTVLSDFGYGSTILIEDTSSQFAKIQEVIGDASSASMDNSITLIDFVDSAHQASKSVYRVIEYDLPIPFELSETTLYAKMFIEEAIASTVTATVIITIDKFA